MQDNHEGQSSQPRGAINYNHEGKSNSFIFLNAFLPHIFNVSFKLIVQFINSLSTPFSTES